MNFSTDASDRFLSNYLLKFIHKKGQEVVAEELKKVIIFDQLFFPQPWSTSGWQGIVETKNRYYLLQVEAAQKLIGIALFDMIEADNCAHLLKIAVDPQFRQRQIAAKILQEAFSFIGKTEQFLKIYLEVEEQNKVAIKLYQRAGFSAIHRLRNFYGQGKDGLAMIRFMKK